MGDGMTPVEQSRNAEIIAKICGWKRTGRNSGIEGWEHPDKPGKFGYPNYYEDLDACREMEEFIPLDLQRDYCWHLANLNGQTILGNIMCYFAVAHASAPQRCEGFLRVMKPKPFHFKL